MALYCGIDLHSSRGWIAILDEGLQVVRETDLSNDLEMVLGVLAPYREELPSE